jgi:hypothetical protein
MAQTKSKPASKKPSYDEGVIMEKIKSFEDACSELKLDPIHVPDVSMLPEKHRCALIAHYKLIVIAEALNQGWQPNWNDHDEYKYYPWFEVEASKEKPSGFGFSYTYCDTGTRIRVSALAFAIVQETSRYMQGNNSNHYTKNTF